MHHPHANPKKGKTDRRNKRARVYKYKPRVPHGPHGMKLKQVLYYQFTQPVKIYHFQASFITISDFRFLLNRQEHGYVSTLLSADPLTDKPLMDGDEMPNECLEVGYLRDVFVNGGSALGFRLGNNTVEWMCFDRDIRTSILDKIDVRTVVYPKLFEHVGDTLRPEGSGRKVWFTEHRDWFECLKEAGRKPVRVSITWCTYGTELQKEHWRLKEERERVQRGGDVVGQEDQAEEATEEQEREEDEEEGEDQEGAEGDYPAGFETHRDDGLADVHGSQPYQRRQVEYDEQEEEGVESQPLIHTTGVNLNLHFNHPNIAQTIEKYTPLIYRDPDPRQGQGNNTIPFQPQGVQAHSLLFEPLCAQREQW
jgi:hypothetical protein